MQNNKKKLAAGHTVLLFIETPPQIVFRNKYLERMAVMETTKRHCIYVIKFLITKCVNHEP